MFSRRPQVFITAHEVIPLLFLQQIYEIFFGVIFPPCFPEPFPNWQSASPVNTSTRHDASEAGKPVPGTEIGGFSSCFLIFLSHSQCSSLWPHAALGVPDQVFLFRLCSPPQPRLAAVLWPPADLVHIWCTFVALLCQNACCQSAASLPRELYFSAVSCSPVFVSLVRFACNDFLFYCRSSVSILNSWMSSTSHHRNAIGMGTGRQ